MSENQQKAVWVFYMLSRMRRRLLMDWPEFNTWVERYDLIGFLFNNHELLHYYDNNFIEEDILRHVTQLGGDLCEQAAVT